MFDLAINRETGDLIFSPHVDLLGSSGENLLKQRVFIRCKIPRGTWIYDEDGSLGSNLYKISRNLTPAQLGAAAALVREALSSMEDYSIDDVQVFLTDDNRILVNASLASVTDPDEIIELSEAVDITVAV
jgi:hypothetical protein